MLKDTAWWIAGHHAEWGGALIPYFENRAGASSMTAAERDDLQQKLAVFGNDPAVQQYLARTATAGSSPAARQLALATMAVAVRTRMKALPPVWIDALAATLRDADHEVSGAALSVVRAAPVTKEPQAVIQAAVKEVALDARRPRDVRLDALAAIQDGGPALDAGLFDLLRSSLEPSQPAATRALAAAAVEKAKLDRAQLLALTEVMKTAGPLEISRLLRAFEAAPDEQLGLGLIDALEKSQSAASVRPDVVRMTLTKYPASVQSRADAFLAKANTDTAKQAKRLDELLPTLGAGDVRRGQAVFNSAKATCATCHAIGYIGGKIGPDLTRIGQVRTERDLLEAIVYPSASFARSYEPVTVTLKSGRVHGGVLRSDLRDEVVLATAPGEEVRLARQDIRDLQPATVSLMPQGLAEQLSREELADLIAFLKASR